jgi:hypothetical protein
LLGEGCSNPGGFRSKSIHHGSDLLACICYELVGDVQDFDANVFRLGHGSVKGEVFKVDRAKACIFLREYIVEKKFEKHQ